MKKYFTLLAVFVLFQLQAQNIINDDMRTVFDYQSPHQVDYSQPLKHSTNELKAVTSAVFLFYKSFISSQDKPSCIFTPSCSVYAVEAIQKKGFFLGWLMAFDRLSRCHVLVKPNQYPMDKKTQRYYDPVQ